MHWDNLTYDIIGDVHGYASLLKKLLTQLGYHKENGYYSHPNKKAIFVGDFINRGPEVRKTLKIIRAMEENDAAEAVLGNHEFNAILYSTRDKNGFPLLSHSMKNRGPFQQTLKDFFFYPEEWDEYVKWMKTLPLFIEKDGFRIVHAYWNDANIRFLKAHVPPNKLKKSFLRTVMNDRRRHGKVIRETLKGLLLELPQDLHVRDNRGISHRQFRINWWEQPEGKSFRKLSFGVKFKLPEYTVPKEILPDFPGYGPEHPIVFFGHYCLAEGVTILQSNLCCVDSCVATTGNLSAYSWNGEKILTTDNITSVSME